MDKSSLTNHFPQAFTNISAEENFVAVTPLQVAYKNSGYSKYQTSVPLENIWNAGIKRCFDILISLVLIVFILSWLIPLMALLIKLDSRGPVFFLQKRNRDGGRLFTCIKFRSMFVNKDADILVACENDKRITRLGKFLRSYHIDELPQLFNVLTGDMSIIGPRPHMISENIIYGNLMQEYEYRHTVKPGITGLAQSLGNFGSSTDIEKVKERVRLDIQYITNWSFGMDIKILYRTSLIMLGFMQLDK